VPLSISPRRERRGSLALALLALLGLIVPGTVLAAKPPPPAPVNIQILNVSDWHSNIDPQGSTTSGLGCSGASPCGIGGAWGISDYWDADEAAFSGPTLRLTAGDDFGASPPLAGFFNEQPGVMAERMMGIQVNTFGNHNFDKGLAHLQSMIDYAAAPTDADHPGQPFTYVATNLKNLAGNLTGVDPIKYFDLGGAKVAVLGIVNEDAPTLVSPGNFGTIVITDGVEAVTKYAAIARKAGANAVIVITHKGFATVSPSLTGTLVDFASALPQGLVDVVMGDHTNLQGSGTAANGVLYHENLSFGNSYAKTLLTVQPGRGGTTTAKSVTFVSPTVKSTTSNGTVCPVVTAPVPDPSNYCDQAILDALAPTRLLLAAALDGVIGTTTQPFDRGGNIERRREMPIGDLVADSMRERYGVQIGYMTGGGIRSQFPACSYAPTNHSLNRANWNAAHDTLVTCGGYGTGTPYDVVIGDVYSVLTFGNNVQVRNVTGIKLWQALENGVSLCPVTIPASGTCAGRFPQVSGIKFSFDVTNATGCTGSEVAPVTWACVPSRICSVELEDGTDIPYDNTTYTMAITDFTNAGGDSYFMLADGQGASQDRDANVLLAYLQAHPNLDPTSYALDRISMTSC